MPTLRPFEYAVVRVVPLVEREEFVNAGVVLFCAEDDLLVAALELDEARLVALAPEVDLDLVRRHLEAFQRVCEGGPNAAPIGLLPPRERFHWLVSPRSTVIQTSAPHAGLCDAPRDVAQGLLDRHVRPPRRRC